jgi:hypothetical protein
VVQLSTASAFFAMSRRPRKAISARKAAPTRSGSSHPQRRRRAGPACGPCEWEGPFIAGPPSRLAGAGGRWWWRNREERGERKRVVGPGQCEVGTADQRPLLATAVPRSFSLVFGSARSRRSRWNGATCQWKNIL